MSIQRLLEQGILTLADSTMFVEISLKKKKLSFKKFSHKNATLTMRLPAELLPAQWCVRFCDWPRRFFSHLLKSILGHDVVQCHKEINQKYRRKANDQSKGIRGDNRFQIVVYQKRGCGMTSYEI